MGKVFVLVVKNLFGHAVLASKITAVGHADAQISQGSVAQIGE